MNGVLGLTKRKGDPIIDVEFVKRTGAEWRKGLGSK